MNTLSLYGKWDLHYNNKDYIVDVPSTLLKNLIDMNLLDDPYYRLNEYKAIEFLKKGMTLKRKFYLPERLINNKNYLVFEGIDTIASIYINNVLVKEVSDSHTTYRIPINEYSKVGINELKVEITSPIEYLKKEFNENELFHSFAQANPYFPKIRKTSCSFGWDWGPNLPDMGIFRNVYIESSNHGFITEFRHKEVFKSLNEVDLKINVKTELGINRSVLKVSLYSPKGELIDTKDVIQNKSNTVSFNIKSPELWFPNGYGKQPIYEVKLELISNNDTQVKSYKIGLRDLKIDTSDYEYGKKFHVNINGYDIFIKGSNYIPEDQIYPNITYDKTKHLLLMAKASNHNAIRIWGGGYYLDDYFYSLCDELGILVMQDLMFACATYDANDPLFISNIKEETICNLRRIRHHASLILISGNNECEEAITSWDPPKKEESIESYKIIFHDILKKIVETETDLFYLSSSPTSEEPYFINCNKDEMYDRHYWEVWHGLLDIDTYRNIYPKLCSEAGLQSYPSMNMIRKYANPDELYETSEVMLSHQKDPRSGNLKIHSYISKRFPEPNTFEDLVYLSQLSQAEALRTLAEHLRIYKGRCMGMIYWQLNDCWGVQSWSSIDYLHIPKLLQYYSKKFYKDIILAIENNTLYLLSDSIEDKYLRVVVEKHNFDKKELDKKYFLFKTDFNKSIKIMDLDKLNDNEYYKVQILNNGRVLYETFEFNALPKELKLDNPHLTVKKTKEREIIIESKALAYGVFLESLDDNVTFSDNGFVMEKNSERVIRLSKDTDLSNIKIKSLYEVSHNENI